MMKKGDAELWTGTIPEHMHVLSDSSSTYYSCSTGEAQVVWVQMQVLRKVFYLEICSVGLDWRAYVYVQSSK